MKKVLIVDNHDSFTYNLKQIVEQHNGCVTDVIRNDEIDSGKINNYAKIIFSPGPGLPGERKIMTDILRDFSPGKSILGVCLGHKEIGEFYGAKLINLHDIFHGAKTQIKIIMDDLLFTGVPDNFDAGLYHSWAVSDENFPYPLEITARSESGIIMAIRHKFYDIRSVQFHPESILTPYGVQIISNWLNG